MTALFRDHQKEVAFLRDGFVLLNLKSNETLERLTILFDSYLKDKIGNDKSFYYSLMNDSNFNERIQKEISYILKQEYDTWFKEYETFSESFLVKKAKDNKELFLHQDWNYVDEFNTFSVTIWIPLGDSFPENGGLFLIPGTHKIYKKYRSSTLPTDRFQAIPTFKTYLKEINIKKGEVVAFHPGVFHGSFPNNQNYNRPVVASVIKKKDDSLVYVNEENNQTYLYTILADTFLKELSALSAGQSPKNFKSRLPIEYKHRNINREEFLRDINENYHE